MVVGSNQDGNAIAGGVLENADDAVGRCAVEAGRGLVHHQYAGAQNQGAGNGDTLAFTTGELRGTVAHTASEAHQVQEVLCHLGTLFHFAVGYGGGEQDVLQGAHAIDQGAALVHVTNQARRRSAISSSPMVSNGWPSHRTLPDVGA